jgi:tetratricopeptide (TPR) repeat protein
MLLRVLLVVFIMLSAACAHVETDEAIVGVYPSEGVRNVEAPVVEKAVEPSGLDAALLYSLLGGEIAGQRGNVSMASAFYVNAAKRSGNPQIALRAAQIALYNKDVAAAKSAIDILIDGDDLPVQTRRLALTVYLRASDVDSSLAQIDALLNRGDVPKRNALLAIGNLVARNASKNVAMQVMDKLVAKYSDEAGVYLARSQIMLSFRLIEQAQADSTKVTQLDETWPTGFVQLARVLEVKGDTGAALDVLKEASERLEARQLKMAYGQLLAKDEQYEAAKKQFLSVIKKEPSYAEAKFALGLVYLKLDEIINAKNMFEALYEDGEFRSKVAFYLGRITRHQKEYKEALGWFEKVERGDGYIDAQATIAMIRAEMDDVKGARSVIQKLRNDYPKQASRFYLLEAELLMDRQLYDAVYQVLTEALNVDSENLSLRYARSIAATQLDKLSIAEGDLLFVLAKQPKDANALNALGYTLASKTFRFKEARQYLTKALLLRPNDAAILDSMGWLNYREGQYEQALVLLEKAYRKTPEGEIAAHLGEALWMLGRQMEARVVWQEALKRDTSNRYLIEVIERLE